MLHIVKPVSLNSMDMFRLCAFVGLGVTLILIGHLALMAGMRRQSYEASQARIQEIQQQAALEDEAAKHRPTTVSSVRLSYYTLSDQPPAPFDIAALKLTKQIVQVVDKDGRCVGTIEHGRFLFAKFWRGVCDNAAIQKRYDNITVGT